MYIDIHCASHWYMYISVYWPHWLIPDPPIHWRTPVFTAPRIPVYTDPPIGAHQCTLTPLINIHQCTLTLPHLRTPVYTDPPIDAHQCILTLPLAYTSVHWSSHWRTSVYTDPPIDAHQCTLTLPLAYIIHPLTHTNVYWHSHWRTSVYTDPLIDVHQYTLTSLICIDVMLEIILIKSSPTLPNNHLLTYSFSRVFIMTPQIWSCYMLNTRSAPFSIFLISLKSIDSIRMTRSSRSFHSSSSALTSSNPNILNRQSTQVNLDHWKSW